MHRIPSSARLSACVFVLFALVATSAARAEPWIVQDGQPRAQIVIADDAIRVVELAAEQLRDYVKQMTGAELPIVHAPSNGQLVRIFVGRSRYTDARGIEVGHLEHGGFRMVSGENWLALVGIDANGEPPEPYPHRHSDFPRVMRAWDKLTGDMFGYPYTQLWKEDHPELGIWEKSKRGSFNATTQFLREQGVRWFAPHEMGEVVPSKDSIALPDVDKTVRPDYPLRMPVQWARRFSFNWTTRKEALWQLRMGWSHAPDVHGLGYSAHGIDDVTEREITKRAHPEYYALYNGKRETAFRHGGKPCLSSEGLRKANIKYVRSLYNVFDAPMVSVMPADAYVNLCDCQYCEGKSAPDRGYRGFLSDYVWSYVNRIAKAVYETHPDRKILCSAYGSYLQPPRRIEKFSPNIVVTVSGHRNGYHDPAKREAITELRRRWLELLPGDGRRIIMNDKYRSGDPWPAFFPRAAAWDLRQTKGVSYGDKMEVFREGRGGIGYMPTMHLNLYVTSRCWWDADLDIDALLDDYYTKFYGPARGPMQAFIEYCEENWADFKNDKAKIKKAQALMADAQAQVDDGTIYAKRVQWIADFVAPMEDRRRQLAKPRENVPEAELLRLRDRDGPITVDGRLDESIWSRWPHYELREMRTGREPMNRTTFRAVWDARTDSVYFGIRCHDTNTDGLVIGATEDGDPGVWSGDCIEILLETQPHSYYQLAVSPAGALIDADRAEGVKTRWSSLAEVATHVDEDGWNVEIRIPIRDEHQKNLDPLNGVAGRAPTNDLPWFFNLCRQRMRDRGNEWSMFSPTGVKGFHKPRKFGKLHLD